MTSAGPAPPLQTTDRREVMRWLDLVTHRMIDLPDEPAGATWRLRHPRRQFHLEYHRRRHGEGTAAQAERHHAARAAGTYRVERDARRTAIRPIYVEVDPTAWAQ